MVDEIHVCEILTDGRVLIYNNTDQEHFTQQMEESKRWPLTQTPPHFFLVKLSTDVPHFCDAVEPFTEARCHKDEHSPEEAHNGWSHYPGQLVSWMDGVEEIPNEFDFYYGPTDWDSDPGKMWHRNGDCNGEVWSFDNGWICIKCDRSKEGVAT
jgi:hypothetical protein